MPEEYLESLSVDQRAEMWRNALAGSLGPKRARFVAARPDLVGFILVGPESGEDDAVRGEVFSLNVHPTAWGEGIGSTLLERGGEFLAEQGFDAAILWAHRDSTRTRRFYEHNGWQMDGSERTVEVLGAEAPEVRYVRQL